MTATQTLTTTAEQPPSTAADRYVSLYTDLARTVRDEGLLRRRYGYYWSRITAAVAVFVVIWVAFFWLGNSWFQLILAAALALVVTQFGFLGHDGGHRQIFASAAWNDWTARILAGAFAGLSYGWWKAKHNRHHAAPNQEGRDPDIGPGALAFTPGIVGTRTGFAGWFADRQGWFFFPLLTLEGMNLHIASLVTLFRRDSVRHQRIEALLVIGRLGGYVTVLLMVLPPGKAAAFFGLQMALFGLFLGGSFAPNHKGMPIVPATMKLDFLRRQVLMSRNVHGNPLTDFAMGGLNYQIEHHLFPSMPRPNLRLAQPLVRAHCERHDISYNETSLLASYGIVVRYLNDVGLRARDPFDCPLAEQFRS
ncbi:MAG: acyl-CoA desaturase [Nocardioidaceae bacterium]|nr:acyl-CoA desaturase [Nocardioidaceae bacterium]